MNQQAGSVHSTPASSDDCPVIPLARLFDELASKYMDDAAANGPADRLSDRMSEIADAASYLSPRSATGAAFQIMLANAETDLTLGSANTPVQLELAKAKVDRLLYRLLDFFRSDANQLAGARQYMMSEKHDPARRHGKEKSDA